MENNLHIWIKHITEQDLPIFNHTAAAISQITQDDDSSPAELAAAIMQDTTLTARILRVANSPLYNRSGQSISTISRAVMYIGFHRVRDISLSLAIVDSLLQENTHDYALDLLAESFHAAVLARALADTRSDRHSPEEFFIAALLYHLGEMAFWCLSGPAGDKILTDLRATGLPAEQAQYKVLGTTFQDITQHLNRSWKLSDLLRHVHEDHHAVTASTKIIQLAHHIARLNHQQDNPQLKLAVVKLGDELKIKLEKLNRIVDDSKAKAIEIATALGAKVIADRIGEEARPQPVKAQTPASKFPEADAILQLTSLRKLSLLINDQPNINHAIQVILEGIHHGIGLDRAAFILFDQTNQGLRPKFCYGLNCKELDKELLIRDSAVVESLMKETRGLWIKPSNFLHADKYRVLLQQLSSRECFVCTITLNQQPIGVIYADRRPSLRQLSDLNYEGFLHFCQQAQLALNYIVRSKSHTQEA